jgi:hypothetical protein
LTSVFRSVHHPGTTPPALVLLRAQAEPVALALLGVFVVALVGILRGEDVLGLLLWAAPLAYVLAAAWAAYDLSRRPAEVVLQGGFGAVRSVWDVAWGRERRDPLVRLLPVFAPFRKDGQLHVGIGDAVHTLRPEDWPELGELVDAFRTASEELQGHVAA